MTTTATLDDLKNDTSQIADEAKSTASKLAAEAKSGGNAIGNEVKNFISDLEEMVTAKTHSSIDISKIKSDIAARIAEYKSSAEAAGRQVVLQAKEKAEGVNSYVHEEPWKVIGASFAVGLLLGAVISRR